MPSAANTCCEFTKEMVSPKHIREYSRFAENDFGGEKGAKGIVKRDGETSVTARENGN